MPIHDYIQPLTIFIEDDRLRLRKPSREQWSLGFSWYQNKDIMYYSEGIDDRTYSMEEITRMYDYLSETGELYFIELMIEGEWLPIGDATLSETNLPVTIGDSIYWGQGIGKLVVRTLIERAKTIGIERIINLKIYHYNERSIQLYTSLGFKKVKDLEEAGVYELDL